MDSTVIIALISFAGTLIGSLGGVLTASKLTEFRLKQLENTVHEHNNYAKRLPVLEEQMKVANHRIDDLEKFHKPN